MDSTGKIKNPFRRRGFASVDMGHNPDIAGMS